MKNTKSSICAVCKKASGEKILFKKNFNIVKDLNREIFSARRLPDKIHGTIVKCQECGLVRSLEIIDRNQLNKLYTDSDFTYSNLTDNLRQTYKLILKTAGRYVPKKSSFLEIGCGNGFMLEEAKQLGYKSVAGVEPSVDAISHAAKTIKKYITNSILEKDTFPAAKFDLICLFQVFDHIPDPNEFLSICHKILKPKGVLVLMNHDTQSISAKILSERSPIYDIEHTYLYDQATIRQILTNNQFKVKKVYSPPAIMTIRYIARLLPLPKAIKRFLSGLKLSILDKTIKFQPGNLCAIAIKQ